MDKFNSQYATKKLRETSATSAGPGSANMTAGDGEQYTTRTKKNEIVKKVGDKYAVYPKKGGKRLGTHDSKEKANKQLAAIEISKSQKESKIPADWTDAPSIPNRPSKGGFQYKQLFENMMMSDVELDYPEFIPVIEKVADYLGIDIQEFQSAQYNVEDEYIEIFIPKSSKVIMIDVLPGGKLKVNTSGPVSSMQAIIDEEELKEGTNIPLNIVNFAKKKGISAELYMIANWVEKAGKRIVGGTAIGKNYNTLILDLTHQGSEIYYNIDNGSMEVNGQPVDSYEEFLEALTVVDGSLNENETSWPEEIFSRHKDMKFVKQSETEKGVTYQIIDLENNDKPMRSIRFSSIETLEDYAQNLIKPQGGTQSTYLGENYSRFKKETKTRTNEQQLHAAMRLAEKKIHEANRILEYTSQLRGELNETKANKNTQKLMEKIKKGITEAYGKMKKMGTVSAPTEKQDFFGMSKQDFDALIAASERNRYRPSPEKIAIVKSKFPNISDEQAAIALKLINSPAQDTFTRYDVMNYLQKYR